jgi:predicted negative regulator of RcsB-dependent stress response
MIALRVDLDWAGERSTMDGRSILIAALLIAVAVVGYLYWDSQQNTVVKLPGVTIKKN